MLADLKAWLRIGSDDEDGVLERLLGSASGLCEQFIGQWLVVREASETIVADGSWRRLTARPVVAMIEKVNRAIDDAGLREWHAATDADLARRYVDRKSTRLNSSH